jgi:hypothetical protein
VPVGWSLRPSDLFGFHSRRKGRFQAGLLTAAILGLAHPAQGGESTSHDSSAGDVVVSVGGEWPQTSTSAFYDPGFNIAARAAYHLPFLKGVIPTLGLGATFFPSESGLVDDVTESFVVLAKEESDRYSFAMNLGIQIGSPTRRGFFRPRAGIAPGFYALSKHVERTLPGDVDPYYSKSVWLGRAGWKGVVGADLFVSREVGIALEFVYDQVWHLDNQQSGRYQGFAIGVTFAVDQMETEEEWGKSAP